MKQSSKKILVIEDDSEIRSSVNEVLENHGYDVYSAGDGEGGIKMALQIKPDLILCDVMMPGKNGHDVFKEIAAESSYPIPFIYLTAKSEIKDIRKGLELGADDYITKPFRAKALVESIRIRLSRLEEFRNSGSENKNADHENDTKLTIDQSIFIGSAKEPRFIKIEDIEVIKSNGDLTVVYTKNGERVFTRKSMAKWIKVLPSDYFYRTHRMFIINSKYINKIEPWFKRSFRIQMQNVNEKVFISERYATKLKKLFP